MIPQQIEFIIDQGCDIGLHQTMAIHNPAWILNSSRHGNQKTLGISWFFKVIRIRSPIPQIPISIAKAIHRKFDKPLICIESDVEASA